MTDIHAVQNNPSPAHITQSAAFSNLQCAQCSQRRDLADLTLCSGCNSDFRKPRRYFCIHHCYEQSCDHSEGCKVEGHQTCWFKHIGSFPPLLQEDHEKTSALADACIQVIVPPKIDDESQRLHHQVDKDNEWFRVTMARMTAQGEEPYLQVSDRFRRCCNPGNGNYWSLSQYPSLVSFIGDTGVGKSTLVRAMNTVGIIEAMKQNGPIDWSQIYLAQRYGPVTRSTSVKRSNLPTSVGVHLYRDDTLVGRQKVKDIPILFADCEGFNASNMVTDAELNAHPTNMNVPNRPRSVSTGSQTSQSSPPGSQNSIPTGVYISGMDTHHLQEEIAIKAPDFTTRGKLSAELFYARFLYAFSDVVVFVIKEEQKMKRDMQRLLEWTISAVETSVRRSSPRTLLIVRNGPSNHDDSCYLDQDLKSEMLDNFGKIWEGSAILIEYKNRHDERCTRQQEKIWNNEQYFNLFFKRTRICYIPSLLNQPPPDKLYNQYLHLRKHITDSVIGAQEIRSQNWTRHDVSSLTHLTHRAFRHFAEYDRPFDFHEAARRDNPTPISIPGHIANLLRHLGSTKEQIEKFENIVAVCLVTYDYRSVRHGREPEDIFDDKQNPHGDLNHKCWKGIEIYQERFLRCALVMEDGTRCINYGYNHGPGHCSEKNLLRTGPIDRSGFEKQDWDIVSTIKKAFIDMYTELWGEAGARENPDLARVANYRRQILSQERISMPGSLSRTGTLKMMDFDTPNESWLTAKSNMTCFACLQYYPDHILPCGHGLCEECVKDFGAVHARHRYHYSFEDCVLCGFTAAQWNKQPPEQFTYPEYMDPEKFITAARVKPPQTIKLDPRCGGIRVLSLDGGGVRGIIELAILEKIEERIGLKLPIREFFDLVVGTSTGGIVALAVTSSPREVTTKQLCDRFIDLAEKVFKTDRFGVLWNLDPLHVINRSTVSNVAMFLRVIKSRYQSRKLKSSLLQFFDETQPIFGDAPVTGRQRRTRVAVTTTSDGEPCLFSNYSRAAYDNEDLSDRDHLMEHKGFERQDNPKMEARVWEAAMATSAAPGYFHEWRIDDLEKRRQVQVPFVDGALMSNLPVEPALAEQDRIWPLHKGYKKPLDIMLSIGTGKQPETFKIPKWMNVAGTGQLAMAYIKNVFDTDYVWGRFTNKIGFNRKRHVRLNIKLEKNVDLDACEQMQYLYQTVSQIYNMSKPRSGQPLEDGLWSQIEHVAQMLIASVLFFEPPDDQEIRLAGTSGSGDGGANGGGNILADRRRRETIKGHIWCRLEAGSEPLHLLVNRISGFYHKEGTRPATRLSPDLITRMNQQLRAGLPIDLPCSLDSTDDSSIQQTILVGLRPPTEAGEVVLVPISGFPITFNEMRAGMLQRGVS